MESIASLAYSSKYDEQFGDFCKQIASNDLLIKLGELKLV